MSPPPIYNVGMIVPAPALAGLTPNVAHMPAPVGQPPAAGAQGPTSGTALPPPFAQFLAPVPPMANPAAAPRFPPHTGTPPPVTTFPVVALPAEETDLPLPAPAPQPTLVHAQHAAQAPVPSTGNTAKASVRAPEPEPGSPPLVQDEPPRPQIGAQADAVAPVIVAPLIVAPSAGASADPPVPNTDARADPAPIDPVPGGQDGPPEAVTPQGPHLHDAEAPPPEPGPLSQAEPAPAPAQPIAPRDPAAGADLPTPPAGPVAVQPAPAIPALHPPGDHLPARAPEAAADQPSAPPPRGRDRPVRRQLPAPMAEAPASGPRAPTQPEAPQHPADSPAGFANLGAHSPKSLPAEQSTTPLARPEAGIALAPHQPAARPLDEPQAADPAPAKPPVTSEPAKPDPDVAIATRNLDGLKELDLRLTQSDLGRIDVRLSIPEKGRLEAIVASDNPAALDMLRREGADLARALAAAAPSSDGASLSFQSRTPDEQSGRRGHPRPRGSAATPVEEPTGEWRPMALSGRIERIA